MKRLLLFLLLLGTTAAQGATCPKEGDIRRRVRLEVAAETSTYTPWYSDTPLPCLLVRERGEKEFRKWDRDAIEGFRHQSGCRYRLLVEKTILRNPPADASSIRYRLIRILRQELETRE